MTELWLNFIDEYGDNQRVLVEAEKFIVGRHSANNLSVPSARLSREHLLIERFTDDFVVSDLNSSNGTFLNGEDLIEPVALKNGDKLDLGGGLQIEVEIISFKPAPQSVTKNDQYAPENASPKASRSSASAASATSTSASTSANSSSIPMSFFYLAPLFGLMILLIIGVIALLSSGNTDPLTVENNGDDDYIATPEDNNSPTPEKSLQNGTPTPTQTNGNPTDTTTPTNSPENGNPTDTPKISDEKDIIERNAFSFLRRIAQNDPKALITGKQVEIVSQKIRQIKTSSALAANIQDAGKSATQIQSLATAKNLKPQFLAVAALTKLGNTRGNVAATAQSMVDVLDKLSTYIGNELANDSLLVIAAYDQGVAGKNMQMRDMLAGLTQKSPESSRQIRTIWFLRENNKITDAEFEFALRFLAIGTIAQNPKDFNVNAEPITF